MFEFVGDTVAPQLPRAGSLGIGTEKGAAAQQAERTRESRPVEGAGDSAESRLAARGDESQKTRTRLEDGKIIVDVYDGDGRLLKRTPPGYLPFGEIA